MIRNCIENLAKTRKRARIEEQSSSDQSTLQQEEEEIIEAVHMIDDNEQEENENSEPEVKIVQFETGPTNKRTLCIWHEGILNLECRNFICLNLMNKGFCYTRERAQYFRCVNRDCLARAKIVEDDTQNDVIQGTLGNKEHNHLPNPQRKQANERRDQIRQKIEKVPRIKPSRVLTEVRANVNDEVFVEMGSDKALGHLIQR